MPSTFLITFIHCRPNTWNSQGPLIAAVSAAGESLRVVEGNRLGSPLESRAVINEDSGHQLYAHALTGRHAYTVYVTCLTPCPLTASFYPQSITFYH